MATSNLVNSLVILRDRQMMDDSEFLRLIYRFMGESVDVDEMLARGKEAGPASLPKVSPSSGPSEGSSPIISKPGQVNPAKPAKVPTLAANQMVNPETGEPKDPGAQAENQ